MYAVIACLNVTLQAEKILYSKKTKKNEPIHRPKPNKTKNTFLAKINCESWI